MIGNLAISGLESCSDASVAWDLGAKIIDKSLGKVRQAIALMKVSNAASLKTIGNHRLDKLGGRCCELQALFMPLITLQSITFRLYKCILS
ncbi:MAG: hypothetical protein KME23_01105 [Goleter apudmare HA4340-LM2]|nr:hypothetical protein [Goleter apudmare HA4340-LM2]